MKKISLSALIFLISLTAFSQNETGSGFSIVDPGNQTVNIPFDLEIENARHNGYALDGSSDDYLVTVYDTTNDIELKTVPQAPFENGELTIEDIVVENAGLINIIVEIRARFGGFTITENIDVNVDEDNEYEWRGVLSKDWHEDYNWEGRHAPALGADVKIPVVEEENDYPVISEHDATINSVEIESGAFLTIKEGKTLTLEGVGENSKNDGTLSITENGSVNTEGELTNSGILTIDEDGELINDGTLSIIENGSVNTEGELTNSGTLTIDDTGRLRIEDGGELTNNGYITIDDHGRLRIEDEGKLTITPSGKLSSTGTIINDAGTEGLILESDDTGSASFIHDNSGVGATVERYIAGNKTFHLISTPVEGQTIGKFLDGNEGVIAEGVLNGKEIYAMQHYIEAEGKWSDFYEKENQDILNAPMQPGVTYAVGLASPDKVTFEGTLIHETITQTITYTDPDGNGWNGIGNPFACALNINDGADSFLDANSKFLHEENKAVYIWCPNDKQYIPVNYTPILSENYVASGQGFMVRAKEEEEGETVEWDIEFNTDMRAHEDPEFRKQQSPGDWHNIVLQAENSKGRSLTTALAFNKNMTTGLDVGYDAGLFTDDPSFKFYSVMPGETGDLKLAIQALPEMWNNYTASPDQIPLGITCDEGGQITFSAASMSLPGNVIPTLEDNETGIFTNLLEEDYTAEIPAGGAAPGRFFLHIGTNQKHAAEPKGEEMTTMPETEHQKPSITVYPNPSGGQFFADIKLNKPAVLKLDMYNMQGNSVINIPVKQLGEGNHSVAFNKQHLMPGIYILKIKGYCNKNRSLTFEINERIIIKK